MDPCDVSQRGPPFLIPAFIGPLVQSRQITPCPIYFEVSFLERKSTERKSGRRLDAIVFRNFYCSHITIKRRRQDVDTAAVPGGGIAGHPWVTILRDRPLMEDPHHEDDAQHWHVVRAEEFDHDEFDPQSTAPLRIYLYQSSPMWKKIGLHHVKVITWSRADSNAVEEDSSHGPKDGTLGNLCRSITEQVEIFSDKPTPARDPIQSNP
ncbi:unnamed protein product [Scytosiphon promiscuus]